MSTDGDQVIHDVLACLTTLVLCGLALYLLLLWLRRSRPELSIGIPVGVALAVRILVAIGITVFGADRLRGPDEDKFLNIAHLISGASGSVWSDTLVTDLHEFVFALQFRLLDSPELALRITEASIAVAGLALIAAAAYELAGGRA